MRAIKDLAALTIVTGFVAEVLIKPAERHPSHVTMVSPVSRLSNHRRWLVTFEVDGAPFNVTVMAQTRHLAIEYAEGALWLQLGKPDLDGFAPWCTLCTEVNA